MREDVKEKQQLPSSCNCHWDGKERQCHLLCFRPALKRNQADKENSRWLRGLQHIWDSNYFAGTSEVWFPPPLPCNQIDRNIQELNYSLILHSLEICRNNCSDLFSSRCLSLKRPLKVFESDKLLSSFDYKSLVLRHGTGDTSLSWAAGNWPWWNLWKFVPKVRFHFCSF